MIMAISINKTPIPFSFIESLLNITKLLTNLIMSSFHLIISSYRIIQEVISMIYGYARCSTNEKLQDINRQVRELKKKGATDRTIYLEYESGTKINRAELQKLLHIIQSKGKIIGRPRVTAESIPAIFYQNYPHYKSGLLNKKELSRLCSLSYPTIYKYIKIVVER